MVVAVWAVLIGFFEGFGVFAEGFAALFAGECLGFGVLLVKGTAGLFYKWLGRVGGGW
jgi:hypothetical protein